MKWLVSDDDAEIYLGIVTMQAQWENSMILKVHILTLHSMVTFQLKKKEFMCILLP